MLPTAVSICQPCEVIADPLFVTVGVVNDKLLPLHTVAGTAMAEILGALFTVTVTILLLKFGHPVTITWRLNSVLSVKATGV